jgi:hypothetical protein
MKTRNVKRKTRELSGGDSKKEFFSVYPKIPAEKKLPLP